MPVLQQILKHVVPVTENIDKWNKEEQSRWYTDPVTCRNLNIKTDILQVLGGKHPLITSIGKFFSDLRKADSV